MTLVILLSLLAGPSAQDRPPFVLQGCTTPASPSFENVALPATVTANGKALAPGVYTLRITAEHPSPAPGQSIASECWVEFLQKGAVAGREVATVIAQDEIAEIAKGPVPAPNTARVDLLKERDYVRVWMNSAGTHYLVNLAISR